ncbi:MAG: DNA replication/repair protein RecF [Alphaproteobacteria bacterium]|nr:DNA replication/repair protein RecF [Alphaproteobacteria bacterium]
MAFLSSLKLHHFRCYSEAYLHSLSRGLIVLHGENGAGKTNVLEAVSLLSPGRGLRGARVMEIQKNDSDKPWAVAGWYETRYGDEVRLGTGLDPNSPQGAEKRTVRINGNPVKSQAKLGEYLSCVWLTPQMDRLFLDSSRERRKFLDRLVFAFDPGHSGRVTRYENALSQRSKLLREGKGENAWLSGLEQQMAETGIAIAAARLDFAARLQAACDKAEHEKYFPRARFRVTGTVEELLGNAPALEVEDAFKYQLVQSRERDSVTGGAATGPHKADLAVTYAAKNMAADQCSTGEQKALLIGLILSHARLIKAERGAPPILLLDEVAAHLDESRRGALYEILLDLEAQCWLTGTESNLFEAIEGKAQFFEVKDFAVAPVRELAA